MHWQKWFNSSYINSPQSGYRPQAEDTSLETDKFEFALLRKKSNGDRLQMSAILTQGARQLSMAGLRQTHASLSENELAQVIAQAFLGSDFPPGFQPTGDAMTWIQDSISLAIQLQDVFTDLEIPHYITGGVAASAYGEPRTTRDLDIVIAILPAQLDALVKRLEDEGFYVPGLEGIHFNRLQALKIIQQATIARANIILAHDNEFERQQFQRIREVNISDRGALYLASPEDVILNKLRWRAQHDPEQQWRDVLGILKVQAENLDFDYLEHQAEQLNISSALAKAMIEAGLL
jgi:hypothetical protein